MSTWHCHAIEGPRFGSPAERAPTHVTSEDSKLRSGSEVLASERLSCHFILTRTTISAEE